MAIDRPLPSDSKVEWRKYAESLEVELEELKPKDTGITFRGIRLFTDSSVPEGEAHIRYRGVTVGKITNVYADFERYARHGDIVRLSPTLTLLDRAINKIRSTINREPDEIRVKPTVEYEQHEPGEFPRIMGESVEAYLTRYAVYEAQRREDEKRYGPQ